jgi:hypothetical protein
MQVADAGSRNRREAALEAGFGGYLTKPLDSHVLVDEIAPLAAT